MDINTMIEIAKKNGFTIEKNECNMEVKQMNLNDTIPMMQSEDYKERFKAEYYQLKIRIEKLHNMLIRYDAGTLGFNPNCSIRLLKDQLSIMNDYLYALEVRAEIEQIQLHNI